MTRPSDTQELALDITRIGEKIDNLENNFNEYKAYTNKKIDKLSEDQKTGFDDLKKMLELRDMSTITEDTFNKACQGLEKRISGLEEARGWILKEMLKPIIVGLIIASAMAIALSTGYLSV